MSSSSSFLKSSFAVFAIAAALALVSIQPASAQTGPPPPQPPPVASADQIIVFLLDNNCANLVNDPLAPLDQEIGGALFDNVCSLPPFGVNTPSFSGGGSAAVQSSAASARNDVIRRRTARARRAGTTTASILDEYRYSSPDIAANGRHLLALAASDTTEPDFRAKRFDLFASLGYESLDRETTSLEDGYDSSIGNLTVGADYRFNDKVLAGLVVSVTKQDGDFNTGGEYEMDSLEPSLFVSILPSPRTYVQVVAGQGSQDFDTDRFVDFNVDFDNPMDGTLTLSGLATSMTDSDVLHGSVAFGYDRSAGKFTFGPRVAASYSRTDVDAFSENGGTGLDLNIEKQDVNSLQAVAGFFGSAAFSTGSGVFLPQFGVEYVHEFEDTRDPVTATLVDDLVPTPFSYLVNAPDSGFFNIEAGFSAVLPRGIQPYMSLRAMVGNDLFDSVSAVFGVRFEL
jgi:uncharacterized protein YhjY with autotransporter beta-barrel domain